MSIVNQVRVWQGDVATLVGDVLVIPTTSDGSFGSPWRRVVQSLGLTGPKQHIALGEIAVTGVPSGQSFKQLAFAATVDSTSPTTPAVVGSIGNALGLLTHDREGLQIATPLLGTGVGRLAEESSVRALVAGYMASARPESELVIAVLDPDTAVTLQQLIRRLDLEVTLSTPSDGAGPSEPGAKPLRSGPTLKNFRADARAVLSLANSARQAMKSSALHTDHLAWALIRSGDPAVPETWRDLELQGFAQMDASLGQGYAGSGRIRQIGKMPKFSDHMELSVAAARSRSSNHRLITTTDLLYGLLSLRDCTTAQLIQQHLPRGSVLAGPAADTVPDEALAADRLDLRREVEMMTTVMLAKETPLPLAIGLFGDWGSGKSFFMAMMRERAAELSGMAELGSAEAADFCKNVRQIDFNAWHYADDDLWASLAATIFDGLVASPGEAVKRKKADELGLAQQRAIAADDKVSKAETALREAKNSTDRIPAIGRSAIPIAMSIVARTPDIEKRLRDLGLDTDSDAEKVVAAVKAARTLSDRARLRLGLVRSELGQTRRQSTVMVLGMALLAVLFFLAFGYLKLWALILSALIVVTPTLALAARGANAVLVAAKEARERREAPVENARVQLEQAKREQLEAGEALRARQAELERLRNRGQRLQHLVSSARTEYGSRLSMLSQLRKDFEQLTWLLKPQAAGNVANPDDIGALRPEDLRSAAADLISAGGEPTPDTLEVERIVLYIDDLDRCPPDVVVQVLRAINLLLAFPLFVVVVAVDGRWLEKSLTAQHHDLLEDPRDYLEKIIQIPFVLEPLGADTFRTLVESLVQPKEGWEPSGLAASDSPGTVSEPLPDRTRNSNQGVDAVSANTRGIDSAPVDAGPRNSPSLSDPLSKQPMTRPTALHISAPEADWLSRIGGVLTTPRSAKRLVNIYRMVRVYASDQRTNVFREDPGSKEYRAIILLLAVLMGCSAWAEEIFERLRKADGAAPIEPILRACLPRATADAVCLLQDPADAFRCDIYQRWLPLVRRFSYYVGTLEPPAETAPVVGST